MPNLSKTIEKQKERAREMAMVINGERLDLISYDDYGVKDIEELVEQTSHAILKAVVEELKEIVKEELDNTSNIYGWHKERCWGHSHDIQCPVVALRRKIEDRGQTIINNVIEGK